MRVLPEGKSHKITENPIKSPFSHGFPMVFLWFTDHPPGPNPFPRRQTAAGRRRAAPQLGPSLSPIGARRGEDGRINTDNTHRYHVEHIYNIHNI